MSAFIVWLHNGHNVPRRWKWSGRVEKWVESQRNKWRGRVRRCCRCIWAREELGQNAGSRDTFSAQCQILCCAAAAVAASPDSGYQTMRQSLYNI